ncbi:MAG: PIN domain-containing protein [Pseudomonadota bacterium]|nr:PIN domain-containing protein [Pseudomonadota bacterium]
MSVLVDSCILIDALAGAEPAREYLRDARGAAISRLTWMEVMVGAQGEDEERAIRAFLSVFEVLALDEAVAEETVRLRRARRLKLPDAIIFATARVHGRELATRNTKDFPASSPGVFVPYSLR